MNGRTRFVVAGMAFLYFVSWTLSLGRLIGTKFWDDKYNLDQIPQKQQEEDQTDEVFFNTTATSEISYSYYSSRRYVYFLPHILGALFWWNMYFFQLVPWIRHNYKAFHRALGRCLMVTAILQVASGVGLASTQKSSTIKVVSYILAMAVAYCIYRAYYYAYHRDIPKHKYWVIRLVGYMQTIALQRFWLMVLILTHQAGFTGLYPAFDNDVDVSNEEHNKLISQMFDDSFVICFCNAILVTEWYLAAEIVGMTEAPVRTTPVPPLKATKTSSILPEKNKQGASTSIWQPPEEQSLLTNP